MHSSEDTGMVLASLPPLAAAEFLSITILEEITQEKQAYSEVLEKS